MFHWNDFGSTIWSFFWIFAFIAYLIALFSVLTDLLRDHELNGWWKALWLIFLIFVPFITALVYLIGRGRGMRARAERDIQHRQDAVDSYIRSVAQQRSPADEIAKAKALADSGVITPSEYEMLKSRALAG